MTVENTTWRKLQMEAILGQHYNQVDNLQISENKRRITNLDPAEIAAPYHQNFNGLKSQTNQTFYVCDICEYIQ